MNKFSRSQSGSAHVIIIIILVVAVIGALGFVLWQNFIKPQSNTQVESTNQVTDQESTDVNGNKKYSNAQYSFSYPQNGWTLKETEDIAKPGTSFPEISSDDYAQTGMGLDDGALISVNASDTTKTLDEELAEIKASAKTFGLKDITKTTINGQSAVTYNSEYEGPRYHTVFVKDGQMYDIVYQYADEKDLDTYMDAYALVTSSFKFSN